MGGAKGPARTEACQCPGREAEAGGGLPWAAEEREIEGVGRRGG